MLLKSTNKHLTITRHMHVSKIYPINRSTLLFQFNMQFDYVTSFLFQLQAERWSLLHDTSIMFGGPNSRRANNVQSVASHGVTCPPARHVFMSFLTDATLSQNPGGQAHEEESHDGHLISQVTDHVDLSVGAVSLPLAAIVGILLGGGSARRSAGSAVRVVRGEGIHPVCLCRNF